MSRLRSDETRLQLPDKTKSNEESKSNGVMHDVCTDCGLERVEGCANKVVPKPDPSNPGKQAGSAFIICPQIIERGDVLDGLIGGKGKTKTPRRRYMDCDDPAKLQKALTESENEEEGT